MVKVMYNDILVYNVYIGVLIGIKWYTEVVHTASRSIYQVFQKCRFCKYLEDTTQTQTQTQNILLKFDSLKI